MRHLLGVKKGEMAFITAAAIVLMVIVLTLLVMLVVQVKQKYDDSRQISACTSSVLAHAELKKLTHDEVVPEITCELREVVIDKKSTYDIQKELGDEMLTCWNMWGNGKLDLFNEEKVYCHVCSHITFDHEDITIKGFPLFLQENSPKGVSQTYAQLLTGFESEQARDVIDNAPDYVARAKDITISTNKEYSVIFVYVRGQDLIEDFLEGRRAEVAVAGLLGAALGSSSLAVGAGTVLLGSNPVGWVIGGSILVVGGAYTAYTATTAGEEGWISFVILKEFSDDEIDRLGCEVLPAKQFATQNY